MKKHFVLGLFLLCSLSSDPAKSAVPEGTCDQLSPQQGPLGYIWRGDRCEGIFIQDIRSNMRLKALVILSSGQSSTNLTLTARLPLGTPQGEYHLRVQSLNPQIYYQMDTNGLQNGVFTWRTSEVIDKLPLDRRHLAPLSWTLTKPTVYVPVALGNTEFSLGKGETVTVRMVVESAVPVEEYVVRLTSKQKSQMPNLKSRSSLPATLLEFDLPRSATSGRYKAWIRVKLLGETQPEQQSWDLWLP